MLRSRMLLSLLAGTLLGVVCIVGASIRSDAALEFSYALAFWYNRLLMGFVIGLMSDLPGLGKALLRGAIVGLFVSFAFYSATGFGDPVGFLAGLLYGIIMEYVAFRRPR